jgi:4-amino-4-deoxy-L-arabinose transferase-like glycosyltransferase
MKNHPLPIPPFSNTDRVWLALVIAALALYLFGLGGAYAPTNGDEMVYIHIARLTAESGNWLPLVSELENMRNTKPPMLFWQAMVAGNWGQNWSLWALRLPSIFYTLLTTACIGFLTLRMSGKWRTAYLSVLVYLVFFSTFRYCRVYVTSAPETFWMALPLFVVLWLQIKSHPTETYKPIPSWLSFSLMGLALGIGLAYKSFALIAPIAATLWVLLLMHYTPLQWGKTWVISSKTAWSSVLALGIFGLWFVLDPNPAAVWQEFVLAENAGKMNTQQGYWHAAFFGDYPMWTQLLAYPENAGIFAFVVIGLGWIGLQTAVQKKMQGQSVWTLSKSEVMLVAWLLIWLVIFTLPSQRSARYVIPAMPALAILMALHWEKIGKVWFYITMLICLPAFILLGRIGWVIGGMDVGTTPILILTTGASVLGMMIVLAGFCKPAWCRISALLACFMVYANFSLMVQPLSVPSADYSPAVQQQLQKLKIAVPNGFNGQYERYHFVLPGAHISPYDAEGRNTGALRPDLPPAERLSYLLNNFDAVVWLQDGLNEEQPSCVPHCTLLGQRWHIKSRHREGEITWANLWYPQEWLFRREWLVTPTHTHPAP